MAHPIRLTALLATAILLPSVTLVAQPPAAPPTRNEPTAKDVIKDVEKSEKAVASKSSDPIERIKDEGEKNSQVMATISYLTDVIGPRLSGSPNLKKANDWTRDKLASWGLENSHLEAWGPFGRGWSLKRFNAQVIEPMCIPLIAFPKAWSPGTDGTLLAEVVYFDAKTEADFDKYKGKLKNAIVLVGAMPEVPARFEPLATRLTDKELLELADAPEPAARGGRGGAGGPGAPGGQGGPNPRTSANGVPASANGTPTKAAANTDRQPPGNRMGMTPEMRAQMELMRKAQKFIVDEGAALLVDPSRQGDGGTLFVAQASIPGAASPFGGNGSAPGGQPPARRASVWDKDAPKITPQITLSKEHYNRLVRMIKQGETVRMAVDLSVQFHDDDAMCYNTIAEISGTDLKDEVVMLGGHMDSWHSGTGATDNAAGVGVAMEAVRILKALDLKPRRTIRIGLWSGEEQGLLGSRAYVTKHFGKSPASMFGAPSGSESKPKENDSAAQAEFEKFSGYFNLDNGTGKIRGIYLQGNEAARPIFRKWLQPFREMGASTITVSNTGGTDHQSFDGIGLPGFQFIQDVVDYNTRTHHSNQDLFDRIQADDMKQASIIMAAFVYNTAMRDEKLPRKAEPKPAQTAAR